MKKMTTLCASLLLALGCLTANAMDSQTLVNNPSRYRVISTSPDGIVYADMDSLRAMQTMDYPNSIENMNLTLYTESPGRGTKEAAEHTLIMPEALFI